MLILFDIDGTLLKTDRAGLWAMQQAVRELFHSEFTIDGIDFAGKLDTLIWKAICAKGGIDATTANHDRFRAGYAQHLERRFQSHPMVRLMPGVPEIVGRLHEMEDVTVGVLTGNYPETGRMKLRQGGLDPDVFVIGAWGCDGAVRNDLPPVAFTRFRELRGRNIDAGDVLIIGDTPHDVECARVNGCRSLGVATGLTSVDDLRACGADLAVESLADVDAMVDWMLRAPRVV